jgi:hypothetical protein
MQEPKSFYQEPNAVPGPSYKPPAPATTTAVPMFVQPPSSNGGSQNGDAGKAHGKPTKKKAAKGAFPGIRGFRGITDVNSLC